MKKRFSQRLLELRKRKGMTLAEASIIVGVSLSTLWNYEQGIEPSADKQLGILDRLQRAKCSIPPEVQQQIAAKDRRIRELESRLGRAK